MTLPGIRVTER